MKKQKGYTIIELFIFVVFCVVLSLFFGGIYVIAHFISKFW